MQRWSGLLQAERRRCEMWQKDKAGKVHLLTLNSDNPCRMNGSISSTACGVELRIDSKKQISAHEVQNMCEVCKGIWHIVFTSVDDAKKSMALVTDLVVLRRSSVLTRSKTLRNALDARIRKLEKEADKNRTLRLAQQAYD